MISEQSPHYERPAVRPDYAEAHDNLGNVFFKEEQRCHRALRTSAADQARLRRGPLQPGSRADSTGPATGGHGTVGASAADRARVRRGALQSGCRLGTGGEDTRKQSSICSRRCGSNPILPRRRPPSPDCKPASKLSPTELSRGSPRRSHLRDDYITSRPQPTDAFSRTSRRPQARSGWLGRPRTLAAPSVCPRPR